jgi:hypothetical protein
MNSYGPSLSAEDALALARTGPHGDGTVGEIDPDAFWYGMSLQEVFERTHWIGDFLEAAPLAGHVHPACVLEGAHMMFRSYVRWVIAETTRCHEQGVDGDALGWFDTAIGSFRELGSLLGELAADLQARKSALEDGLRNGG